MCGIGVSQVVYLHLLCNVTKNLHWLLCGIIVRLGMAEVSKHKRRGIRVEERDSLNVHQVPLLAPSIIASIE